MPTIEDAVGSRPPHSSPECLPPLLRYRRRLDDPDLSISGRNGMIGSGCIFAQRGGRTMSFVTPFLLAVG